MIDDTNRPAVARVVDWTPANVELLKSMWDAGKSASQIAAAIGGGCSRNACIGKLHRMGLSRNPTGPRKPQRPIEQVAAMLAPAPVPPPPVVILAPPEPAPVEAVETVEPGTDEFVDLIASIGVNFLELAPRHCKYIAGQPDGLYTLYCGAPRIGGSAYCAEHAKLTGGSPHVAHSHGSRFQKSAMTGVYS